MGTLLINMLLRHLTEFDLIFTLPYDCVVPASCEIYVHVCMYILSYLCVFSGMNDAKYICTRARVHMFVRMSRVCEIRNFTQFWYQHSQMKILHVGTHTCTHTHTYIHTRTHITYLDTCTSFRQALQARIFVSLHRSMFPHKFAH
jgi:hypothetical protein